MKVEPQGPNECMLATIAALANVPLAEVRERALKYAKATCWADVVYTKQYWKTVHALRRAYKAPVPTRATFYRWHNSATVCGADVSLSGRGSVVVKADAYTRYHIMPFEDGHVYDTSTPNPRPETIDAAVSRSSYLYIVGVWRK